MLIRQTALPLEDPAPRESAGALVSWADDVKESFKDIGDGFIKKRRAFHLPANDRAMGLATAVLMAVMLYICAMALLVHFVLGHAARGFDDNLKNTLTFEILPDSSKDGKSVQERATILLDRLKGVPGLASATLVPQNKMAALLEPWLGKEANLHELPLPLLIDVRLEKGATIDKAALEKAAQGLIGVALDDHQEGLAALIGLEKNVKAIAGSIVILALLSMGLCATFAAQANFYMNREMIEILHLIGAEDRAIAAQTGRTLLRLSLVAASAALVAAFMTLIGLWLVTRGLDISFVPNFSIGFSDWLMMSGQWLGLMVFAVGLCVLASRLTVLRALRKIL